MAENLLLELGALDVVKVEARISLDYFAFFPNVDGSINIYAVEVKATEHGPGEHFLLDSKRYDELRCLNVPSLLIVANVKDTTLHVTLLGTGNQESPRTSARTKLRVSAVSPEFFSDLREILTASRRGAEGSVMTPVPPYSPAVPAKASRRTVHHVGGPALEIVGGDTYRITDLERSPVLPWVPLSNTEAGEIPVQVAAMIEQLEASNFDEMEAHQLENDRSDRAFPRKSMVQQVDVGGLDGDIVVFRDRFDHRDAKLHAVFQLVSNPASGKLATLLGWFRAETDEKAASEARKVIKKRVV